MNSRSRLLFAGVVAIGLAGCSAAPSSTSSGKSASIVSEPTIVRTALGSTLDDYLTRVSAFGMSGVALVAKDGEIVLEKGYGSANRERAVPLTSSTPLLIGSLSKQFTAAAILLLEQQGKLSVHDTIGKFFPEAPADKRGITLHQLLTHTSGLPYLTPYDMMADVEGDHQSILREEFATPLDTLPGVRYAYSSPGYTLLAFVVEKVSGEEYNRFVERHLFEPAGMTMSGFTGEKTRYDNPFVVHSYSGDIDEGSVADFPRTPRAMGAGTVITTVGDLYRWMRALDSNTILSGAATKKLFTPYVDVNPRTKYAYGWNVASTIRNTHVVSHGGDIGGYNADFRKYIDEGLTVIFLSNARPEGIGYRDAVMNNLALLTFGGPALVPPTVVSVPLGHLSSRVGLYKLQSGSSIEVWMQNDKLYAGSDDQAGISLLADNDSTAQRMQSSINAATALVANALAHGTTSELEQHISPSLPFESSKPEFLRIFHPDSLGDALRVEPLGSAILSPAMAKSYYRIIFERGVTLNSFTWVNGKIMATAEGLRQAQPTQFVPSGENDFSSFDPFTGKSIQLHFESTFSSELLVESKKVKVRASRVG
jgi:CubicO group peptidase (beta-lactamase class C family)